MRGCPISTGKVSTRSAPPYGSLKKPDISVFDVSQTEGKELPDLSVSELTGDVEQYRDFFAALERTSPFAIAFETLDGGAKGRCYYEENRIAIHEGMSELQNIKTAIHEISHATMHDTAPDDPTRPDRRTREVQAESVDCFLGVVCTDSL